MPTQISRTDIQADALAFARRTRASKVLQYELNVVASSALDVVQSVGGWLFDRRMAGWDVNVLLADVCEERALRILGLTPRELHGQWSVMAAGPERSATLAIAADVFTAGDGVRDEGLAALREGSSEVALWGDLGVGQLGHHVQAVQYRLSGAAQAFKRHALAAAGVAADSVEPVETLFRAGPSSYRWADSDLKPVG